MLNETNTHFKCKIVYAGSTFSESEKIEIHNNLLYGVFGDHKDDPNLQRVMRDHRLGALQACAATSSDLSDDPHLEFFFCLM